MSRVFAILFLIATLVVAGVCFLLVRERDRLTLRVVQNEVEQKKLEIELQALRAERDKLRKDAQLRSAIAQSTAPLPQANATTAKGTPQPDDAPRSAKPQGMKAMAEMMKSPAMREIVKQQQLAGLDLQYAGLYDRFQFDDAEKADFKQLLGERAMLDAEMGLKMMGDTTPEQRNAAVKEHGEAKKASDERIREFLNSDEDYTAFQQWEETKPDRMQVEMTKPVFATAGEPLSQEQQDRLVGAMAQVRKRPSSVPDLQKPENFDPANFSDEALGRQLSRFDADAQAVAAEAAAFLSAKQMEALKNAQQQWRAMAEAGLRMSSVMFRENNAGTAK
ncbi:MAG: hypothetical protein ACOYMN_00805 [Roseimicrobium sp.]